MEYTAVVVVVEREYDIPKKSVIIVGGIRNIVVKFLVSIDPRTGTDTVTTDEGLAIRDATHSLGDAKRFVRDLAYDARQSAEGARFGSADGSVVWSTFNLSPNEVNNLEMISKGKYVDPSRFLGKTLPVADRTAIYQASPSPNNLNVLLDAAQRTVS